QLGRVLRPELLPHLILEVAVLVLVLLIADRLLADRRRGVAPPAGAVALAAAEVDEHEEHEERDHGPEDPGQVLHRVAQDLQHDDPFRWGRARGGGRGTLAPGGRGSEVPPPRGAPGPSGAVLYSAGRGGCAN